MCSGTPWPLIQEALITVCVPFFLSSNQLMWAWGYYEKYLTQSTVTRCFEPMVYRGGENTERRRPKPQLKWLLLHQTSPLVTIIITAAPGENEACDASECMETERHRALEYNSTNKAHSLWLTILISPSLFIRSPAMWSCCQGPPSIPLTQHHRPWEAARPATKERQWRVKPEAALLLSLTRAG